VKLGSEESLADHDSWAVDRLRKAGAVPFARTNLTEFALGVKTNSRQVGFTDNPLLPGHLSGGSSGGSAAAVAAGVCAVALGSDTSGSVRIPASFCGIWGFRPSRERVKLDGLFRLSNTRDTPGLLARKAADLGFVAESFLGTRPLAPLTIDVVKQIHFAFEGTLFEAGDSEVRAAAHEFEALCRSLNLKTERVQIKQYDEVSEWAREDTILDAYPALEEQLRASFGLSVSEVLPMLVEPARGAATSIRRWHEKLVKTKKLADSHKARERIAARILKDSFSPGRILVLPTTLLRPMRLAEAKELNLNNDDFFRAMTSPSILAPCLKAPALSVPVGIKGQAKGVGVMLMARPGEDELLLELAMFLEQKLSKQLQPQFA
jgi:aspartyl-tRNA(Asn)/glutamyl-tRNA(Gln) amidotransferase subunit A